jgi:hypothetical protein
MAHDPRTLVPTSSPEHDEEPNVDANHRPCRRSAEECMPACAMEDIERESELWA